MKIAYPYKLVLLVAGVGACMADKDPPSRMTTTAVIENALPGDGCSFPVTIDGVDYAPDEASLVAVRVYAANFGPTTVTIDYRLTGRTGQVECGFGHKDLPEIAFDFVDFVDPLKQ